MTPYEEEQREQEFMEWLDEVHEPYQLGELTFQASDILKSCDPIAFRVYMSDWDGSEYDE